MAVRDHESLVVDDFRGLIDNGEDESVPQGGFLSSQNNQFQRKSLRTRAGLDLPIYELADIRRIKIYKRQGEAQRLLILDATGKIYDSTNLSVAILNIASMTDFSAVTIFGRAYITPHDGVTGLPGEFVYVYDGSGAARKAAGVGPTGFTLTATEDGGSGSVEAGTRVLAVAFETDTGYVTKHGGHVVYTGTGGHPIDVANIGIGPAGTVARVLLSTKIINDFNGDIDNQTYYEIPDGRVGDNTTTTATVDFFDADLLHDITDYAENLEEIPAGVGIGLYNGRMVVWGTNTDSSVVYVSESGEPESINGVEGFASINPGDAGFGLKACWEHRGQLVCQKSQRTYATQDNGERAAFWSVTLLDNSVGTEPHGVGEVLDFGNIVEDLVIVAHTTGLRIYNGVFMPMPLTYSITDIWDRINKDAFHTIEVAVNPIDAEIFVAVPLDEQESPDCILYGDYTEGLSAATMKWDIWRFPDNPRTVVVDANVSTKEAIPTFGMYTGNVYQLDYTRHNDYGNAIVAYHEHALLPTDSGQINHYTGAQVKVKGTGTMAVSISGPEGTDTLAPGNFAIPAQPRRPVLVGFNFVGYKAAVKFTTSGFDTYYIMEKYELLWQPMWE